MVSDMVRTGKNHSPEDGIAGGSRNAARLLTAVSFAALALAAAAAVFIFVMSSDPAPESDARSGRLIILLIRIAGKDPGSMAPAELEKLTESLSLTVRKAAHFLEFFALGAFSSSHALAAGLSYVIRRPGGYDGIAQTWRRVYIPGAVSAAVFSLLYAASDEFHQTFVPGRSGALADVIIDFAGSSAGIAAACAACAPVFISLIKKKRRRALSLRRPWKGGKRQLN